MEEHDTAPAALRARLALAELFFDELADGGGSFESFEDAVLRLGHAVMAGAMASAPGRRDAELCASLPKGARAPGRRRRTLATKAGGVTFRQARVRGANGLDEIPLAEGPGLPHGCRVSPSASSFPAAAGAEAPCSASARLLLMAGGSGVSAETVMRAMRSAGALCADEDARLARELYEGGALPGGGEEAEELCLEADGTWFSVQKPRPGQPRRCEVKAVVAYAGKEERGGKALRLGPVRHAAVGTPGELVPEAVAAVGTRYDLSKAGGARADGEGWCQTAGKRLPRAEAVAHPGPFHVNRAVLSCFADQKTGWKAPGALWDGGKREAACPTGACAELGEARPERAVEAAGRLRGNMGPVDVEGPSLGTMESENQHLYGVRMDSFPCAWSVRGASDMARIRSRSRSGRAVPGTARGRSATPARLARRERRELDALAFRGASASGAARSCGKGRGRRTRRASRACPPK